MLGRIIYDCGRNWINSYVTTSKFNKHEISFLPSYKYVILIRYLLQIKYHLNYTNQSPNRNFKLFLLFANETISEIFYFKYLEHLVVASNGKLKITYILTRPPSNWEELSGHINEDILCKWLSDSYIPDGLDQTIPTPENGNSTHYIRRYMQALIQDSKHIKLITCGPPLMIDSIEESLNNIGFPVNDKAIFIR